MPPSLSERHHARTCRRAGDGTPARRPFDDRLAKAVTALDVVSRGRALLGIGAAWFDAEHAALGFEFPPLRVRYEHLIDALEICRGMFSHHATTYEGTHQAVKDAFNSPAPIGRIPILVGGQGKQKTFRIAAQYADELNTTANFADIPRKLDALQRHLDDLGRDRRDITVTSLGTLVIGETHDAAVDKLKALINAHGFDADSLLADEAGARQLLGRFVWGDPDEIVAGVRELLALGLDGVVSTWSSTPTTSRRSPSPGRRLRKLSGDATPVASGRRTPTRDVTPSSGGPSS